MAQAKEETLSIGVTTKGEVAQVTKRVTWENGDTSIYTEHLLNEECVNVNLSGDGKRQRQRGTNPEVDFLFITE